MIHPSVEAALQSYRLSAELTEEALLLWEHGKVPRAGALAVAAIEADAKANDWIGEVTRLGSGPDRDHQRRIEGGLFSLAAMFEDQIETILGSESGGGLTRDEVWEIRQGAFYVDMKDGTVLTPERLSPEKVAAVIAGAANIVNSRKHLGTDGEMLSDFFADYGNVYRAYIAPTLAGTTTVDWAVATARFTADLLERWVLPDDQSPVLLRRAQE